MGKEQEVKGEAVELLGSGGGEGQWKLPGMGIPWPFPQAGAVIQSLCPAGIKDTGTNPAFTRAGALGEQMSPCSFTECPKPLFPNAGKVI